MHAVEALNDGLLDLLDALGGLAGLRVDAKDRVVVDLGLEALRPAAVAAKPGTTVGIEVLLLLVHPPSVASSVPGARRRSPGSSEYISMSLRAPAIAM